LCSGALNCGSFTPVQKAKLNTRGIGNAPHYTIERVDFPDQVPLSKPANSRITGHRPQIFQLQCHQYGLSAQARSSVGRLGTGVAAANHNDVEGLMFHVKHSLLA
jgi:hypothetical protein